VNDEAKQILISLGAEVNRKNYLDLMGYEEEPTPEQEAENNFPAWAKKGAPRASTWTPSRKSRGA
jgi:hypothetical protein